LQVITLNEIANDIPFISKSDDVKIFRQPCKFLVKLNKLSIIFIYYQTMHMLNTVYADGYEIQTVK
jgi:hypothetical protein